MKPGTIAASALFILGCLPISCLAETLNVQQNSKINVFSYYQDSAGSRNVVVNQKGDTNLAVNTKKAGSQALTVNQIGRVNVLNSLQTSTDPNGANVVVANQATTGNFASPENATASGPTRDGVTYSSKPFGSGYLSSFSTGNLSITFYGQANSVSSIGRRY